MWPDPAATLGLLPTVAISPFTTKVALVFAGSITPFVAELKVVVATPLVPEKLRLPRSVFGAIAVPDVV